MPRRLSAIAPDWWDYTTLDREILDDAARLTPDDLLQLVRPGFKVVFYDTLEEFYLAEALEYINAWRQATADNPVGICGPIGPTEQLPLVARLVNALELDVPHAHFWGMDEWFDADGREVAGDASAVASRRPTARCASTASAASCGCRDANLHFPKADTARTARVWDAGVRCAVMQGGQGDVKHWAFNDPLPRAGKIQGRAAAAGGVSQARHARGRSAPDDHRAERAHQRRRQHLAGADAGHHRRPGRDLEGGEGLDLACRASTTIRSASA